MSESGASERTRIWDLPTRLFHWLLAALVVFSAMSLTYDGQTSTKVLNPPKNMRLASNGSAFGSIMSARRGCLHDFGVNAIALRARLAT